jgi:uncharacterized SAM-binding protein YcdF (DUF218 family)
MSWGGFGQSLGLVTIVVFIASAFTPLPNLVSRRMDTPGRLEPADAIVVLAGGGSLRAALEGIALHRKGLAPLLVFSGAPTDERPDEAALRAELARELGIPAAAVLTESRARTTREEAARMKALLEPRGVRKIFLVAQSHHMARAGGVFERAGFEVLPAPVYELSLTGVSDPEGRLRLTRWVVEELLARLYYRAAGYL